MWSSSSEAYLKIHLIWLSSSTNRPLASVDVDRRDIDFLLGRFEGVCSRKKGSLIVVSRWGYLSEAGNTPWADFEDSTDLLNGEYQGMREEGTSGIYPPSGTTRLKDRWALRGEKVVLLLLLLLLLLLRTKKFESGWREKTRWEDSVRPQGHDND
jgi:hypothetical protein